MMSVLFKSILNMSELDNHTMDKSPKQDELLRRVEDG